MGTSYDSGDGFSANATLFYNQFDDKIVTASDVEIIGRPGVPDNTYNQQINAEEARTQGIELSARLELTPSWYLTGGYTYTDTEITSGESEGLLLTNAPKHKFTAGLTWQISDRWSTSLDGEYYSSRERFPGGAPTSGQNLALYEQVGNKLDGYELFHLRSSYQLSENVRLTGAIYNLFDKDFADYDTYEYNGQTEYAYRYTQTGRSTDGVALDGRSFWLSATYEF